MSRRLHASVVLEVGTRRVFASAIDWPGWCRSGKDKAAALSALSAYAPRYRPVAIEAGVAFGPPGDIAPELVEELTGDATTDFGAPGAIATADRRPLPRKAMADMLALVRAAWTVFDGVVARAPEHLRKGPRGGGRDRDQVADHVLAAEVGYLRKLGVKRGAPSLQDPEAIEEVRREVLAAMARGASGEGLVERGWPVRYAARRIAWHVLDHAWEIEDKSQK